ncbi:uncharacterized protein LOC114943323 [Nylanderia fulva]|uniref:uncharacterized protein LOC114943323 n=1 Tax=Nylanderia fulva TaxID=613905 RepID=UPI0010FBBBD7|nr:uncharacterized protein LOC114943323 [Nylanderia fulva]
MEKSEFRVLIKHYFLRKKTITKTKEKLDKYYGDSAPSISMVKKWFTEFRCGRTSTSDAERSGRPKEVVTPEIVNKIHGMILDDRRMKVCELAEAVSTERVHHILHEYLDMKKLSARWVPQLLTLDYKRNRVTTSKECLAMFRRNPNKFLRRFVTVDETWIHHNTTETKDNQDSGFLRVNVHQKRPRWVCRPTRSWPPFFGMHAVSFTSITLKRVKRSQTNIIQSF